MLTRPSTSRLSVKLTRNFDPYVPRNFFVHVYNVPIGAVVKITCEEREILNTTASSEYVRAGFKAAEDECIRLTILQEEKISAATVYLIHKGEIFEQTMMSQRPELFQVAWMGSYSDEGNGHE